MADAKGFTFGWKFFLSFIAFGAAFGTVVFLLENIFDVQLVSWIKASLLGVAISVFSMFVVSRFRNALKP